MQNVSKYHPALVALHWLLAILIAAALALAALVMVRLPNDSPVKLEALRSHMVGGGLILSLMLVRFAVRRRSEHPSPATTGNSALDLLAWASHRLLYIAVFAMAGSGLALAIESGLFKIVIGGQGALPPDFWVYPARTVHFAFSRLLMGLIALHIAGALYHTLIRRDGLLGRMAFGRRRSAPSSSSQVDNQA